MRETTEPKLNEWILKQKKDENERADGGHDRANQAPPETTSLHAGLRVPHQRTHGA